MKSLYFFSTSILIQYAYLNRITIINNSKKIFKNFCNIMGYKLVEPVPEKSPIEKYIEKHNNEFIKTYNIEYILGFILVFFEERGNIVLDNDYCNLYIEGIDDSNLELINLIRHKINIPSLRHKEKLVYSNVNCIDILGKFYNNCKFYNKELYDKYIEIINYNNKIPKIKVYKEVNNAVIPSKSRNSDAGFDLTIIKAMEF